MQLPIKTAVGVGRTKLDPCLRRLLAQQGRNLVETTLKSDLFASPVQIAFRVERIGEAGLNNGHIQRPNILTCAGSFVGESHGSIDDLDCTEPNVLHDSSAQTTCLRK